MRHLQALGFWKKISLVGMLLVLNTACVVTPHGGVVGVDGEFSPYILDSNSSFLTVRVGPRFYASDAYLVAYDYCLSRGMYAYEYSPWAHSSTVIRDLRYDCRPTYIAPPMVYHVDRSNRFRYNYFQDYYRTHRSGHHYRPYQSNNSGWWGGRRNAPTQPPVVNPSPGYSRDGRATTPASPWSHNPHKNNRYQPRANNPVTVPSAPASKPGWFGGRNNAATPVAPRVDAPATTPSRPRGGFFGNTAPKSSTVTPKERNYSSDGGGRGNSYTPRSAPTAPSPSAPAAGGSKPGWFGGR